MSFREAFRVSDLQGAHICPYMSFKVKINILSPIFYLFTFIYLLSGKFFSELWQLEALNCHGNIVSHLMLSPSKTLSQDKQTDKLLSAHFYSARL